MSFLFLCIITFSIHNIIAMETSILSGVWWKQSWTDKKSKIITIDLKNNSPEIMAHLSHGISNMCKDSRCFDVQHIEYATILNYQPQNDTEKILKEQYIKNKPELSCMNLRELTMLKIIREHVRISAYGGPEIISKTLTQDLKNNIQDYLAQFPFNFIITSHDTDKVTSKIYLGFMSFNHFVSAFKINVLKSIFNDLVYKGNLLNTLKVKSYKVTISEEFYLNDVKDSIESQFKKEASKLKNTPPQTTSSEK